MPDAPAGDALAAARENVWLAFADSEINIERRERALTRFEAVARAEERRAFVGQLRREKRDMPIRATDAHGMLDCLIAIYSTPGAYPAPPSSGTEARENEGDGGSRIVMPDAALPEGLVERCAEADWLLVSDYAGSMTWAQYVERFPLSAEQHRKGIRAVLAVAAPEVRAEGAAERERAALAALKLEADEGLRFADQLRGFRDQYDALRSPSSGTEAP